MKRWLTFGVAAVCLGVLTGATCVPLVDLNTYLEQSPPTTDLAVSVIAPGSDLTVPIGEVLNIQFTVANLTGEEVAAAVLIRDRDDLSDTIIAGGLTIGSSGSTQTVSWDTSAFAGGEYSIVAQVRGATRTVESSAAGRVTLNSPPGFEFLEPAADLVFEGEPDPNDPNTILDPSLTFRFTAFDADGDGTFDLGLDPDTDPNNGNEVLIAADRPMSAAEGFDDFVWEGLDTAGQAVEAGQYHYYAAVQDPLNDERIVPGLALITVPEDAVDDGVDADEIAITAPTENAEIVGTLETITFEFTLPGTEDVLVDIKLDPDDALNNGNELPILYQRLEEDGTTEDSFLWSGFLANDGGVAPDGIYRPVIFVSSSDGTVTPVAGEGLVFRRSSEGQPLIGVTAPTTDQTVTAGNSVLIRWRDETPDDAFALIRIALDDDPVPNEDVETDDNEILILGSRDAVIDGVSDTFTYVVPTSLAPGVYFIHGSIDRDAAEPIDDATTAAGRIIIRDPTQP